MLSPAVNRVPLAFFSKANMASKAIYPKLLNASQGKAKESSLNWLNYTFSANLATALFSPYNAAAQMWKLRHRLTKKLTQAMCDWEKVVEAGSTPRRWGWRPSNFGFHRPLPHFPQDL